ncbi:purine nucleoside phosphorylase [Rhodonellum psychrophilum GCM71 = DSM 17998]|uniref:Purine nucleoside phosphorylase n=2 Tax=Rhodonellum TaxID=336827 RepID=U5BXQ6_9BACT|nr:MULTISPECIES: purine-nucleoside phosphorylase [Rhodonellum]ERM82663.1 purine nucleoside phosphorylase [Rhodonellum psychrophilum GCM71 = DSM 17998]MDO9553555.1 purine-nucleoside phosphorylase [Rhodonellum sp.]SDZ45549.1 purine-nucleoside phosphorylase [Rhodonellum ikkaensis]
MKQDSTISYTEQIQAAFVYIHNLNPNPVEIGVILGTGLGQLINNIEIEKEIPYEDIPHFPVSTVESHSGTLIFGKLGGKNVVAMKGRFHYYEGYSMKEVTFPIRVMKLLGVSKLMVSNAAGGLNPDHKIGELMVINDHIDLFPENPLRGKNLDEFGVRFPDMSEPYALDFIDMAMQIAKENGLTVHQGVYTALQGPNLETRAEYKYLRTIGADAVGMSTIPEVIVARHMDMKVFAISAITDLCSPGNVKKISIAEVLAAAALAEPGMGIIIQELVRRI